MANGLFSPSNGVTYKGEEIQIQLLDGVNFSPTWEDFFIKQSEVSEGVRAHIKLLD